MEAYFVSAQKLSVMNAFRYALRFLGRQKTFTVINMLGLALSLACCIILTRYLYREATVEKHCIDMNPESWTKNFRGSYEQKTKHL